MMLKELRRDVCEAIQELEKNGLFPLGMGSVSGIDRGGGVVVAPAGIPSSCLTPDEMLVIDFSGQVVEGGGSLKPLPEVAAHLFLYHEFPEIGAVASSFGSYSTRFAQAERAIPCLGIVQARYFKGEIPVTRTLRKPEVERNYDRSVGEVIVERFSRLSARTIPAVLVAHHGAFAWGSNVAETVLNSLALEQSAELAFGTLQLFPKAEALSGMLLDKYFERSGK